MADWLSSMTQTFEFYEVDPGTWRDKRRITTMLSCKIRRDLSSDTLETASIDGTEILGECYVRVYMIVIQNGVTEKVPLGTFLVQTPSISFDGRIRKISMDAYSPLLELRDVKPALGYTIMKNRNIMDNVCALVDENLRAPVVPATGVSDILPNDYTAEADESWLDYILGLLQAANYHFVLDEMGQVLFAPKQNTEALQPRWTYNDDNSSILYPNITDEYDLYGVPNVVEVSCSGVDEKGNPKVLYSRIVNDNPDSPTSTVTRGREVLLRDTSPSLGGIPTQQMLDRYAEDLLKSVNSIDHTLSYSHAYCPVRVGDCVRLNYERAGIKNIKARVISQDIDCTSGCMVSETAVYTSNLWKED